MSSPSLVRVGGFQVRNYYPSKLPDKATPKTTFHGVTIQDLKGVKSENTPNRRTWSQLFISLGSMKFSIPSFTLESLTNREAITVSVKSVDYSGSWGIFKATQQDIEKLNTKYRETCEAFNNSKVFLNEEKKLIKSKLKEIYSTSISRVFTKAEIATKTQYLEMVSQRIEVAQLLAKSKSQNNSTSVNGALEQLDTLLKAYPRNDTVITNGRKLLNELTQSSSSEKALERVSKFNAWAKEFSTLLQNLKKSQDSINILL